MTARVTRYTCVLSILGSAVPALGVELISVAADGGFPPQVTMSVSQRVSISNDGRFVAFHSYSADLVPNLVDANRQADIFVRDRLQASTQMASANAAGTPSDTGGAIVARIGGAGSVVIFESTSIDLVGGVADDNRNFDVYARDLVAGVTELVSVNVGGTAAGDGQSFPIDLSDDGRVVLFGSFATDLVPNFVALNLPGLPDLFARDRAQGVTHWVSSNPAGTQGADEGVIGDAISADGRFVLFESPATNLLGALDTNGDYDVFMRDLPSATTALVSVNAAGTASGAGDSLNARMSADGRFVAFSSTARDLVPGFVDGNGEDEADLFVRDLVAGETRLVSVNAAGTASGNHATTLNGAASYGFSADGHLIAFPSAATDLVAGVADGNGRDDVFVRDLATGVTTCVSTTADGTRTGDAASTFAQVADSGAVIFRSTSTNLVVPIRFANKQHVFVRTSPGARTGLVTADGAGGVGGSNDDTSAYALSRDGRFVAFATAASNILPGDTNATEDVFVYDVLAVATSTPSPTPLPTVALVGDCNGNGVVTVDDLIKGVSIALGANPLSTCPSFDPNGNGAVTVDELVRAVASALAA